MFSGFTPFHRGGSGSPPMCLHGFMDTWRTWELVVPTLERRHQVLAVTLPGTQEAHRSTDGSAPKHSCDPTLRAWHPDLYLGRRTHLLQAGASDFEHGIQPGPVFHFDGSAIGLDLRFGDPDADGRAVEAIAEGFAALGCTLGGESGAPIVSGGS
jgi:hypothetical protein